MWLTHMEVHAEIVAAPLEGLVHATSAPRGMLPREQRLPNCRTAWSQWCPLLLALVLCYNEGRLSSILDRHPDWLLLLDWLFLGTWCVLSRLGLSSSSAVS